MRRFARFRGLLLGLAAIGLGFLSEASTRAAEEAQRFLDALREAGYYDTALEYLEMARTDPLVPKEFKTTIDYEAGVTLIDGSRTERVMSERGKQLDQAQQMLKQFSSEHGDHPLAPGAKTQLANVLVERGRMKVEQAADEKRSAAEKQQLNEDARALYTEAEKVFKDLEQRFLEQHKKYPKFIDQNKEPEKYEERDQVRRDLLQARLALGTVLYEKAQTFEPGTEGHKTSLEESATRYHEMYEKYGARLAGLYARMFEGRCFKELGQQDKAFECFEELLSYEDTSPPFQGLKNKTFVFYLETCLEMKGKERGPRLTKAIENTTAWAKAVRGPDETSPEGLAIKFLGGKAALDVARTLEGPESATQKRDLLNSARRWFTDVSKMPGEYQAEARSLLYGPDFAGPDAERPEPQSFMECVDRGKEAMTRSQDENLSEEERGEARREAIDYYHRAMGMKTEETTAEEMNVLRYYLSFLYFMEQKYYEAAVMGEFLARNYPDGVGARQGAKIAMAAYVTLFNEAPENDRQFEDERMTSIARHITETWEGEPEADEAWMMLINNALRSEELGKAAEYLQHISAESPRRSEAELMTGQKMWAAYLEASRKPEGERPDQARLDAMVAAAQKTLEDGIDRMRKRVEGGESVTYTLVASVLSLAQICIGANQPEKAVTWLEDPKIGALTLVKAESQITDRGNFRSETYKAALRAFVATKRLDDAEEVMKLLEESIKKGGDADAQKKLTQIYISLGRELEDMLQRLRAEGKNEEAAAVSQGFEVFLTRIKDRGAQGNTFASLNWVAETFAGLGAGFDVGGQALPAQAKTYYEKARDTYKTILDLVAQKKIEAPPGADTSIEIRLSRCQRRLGEFKEAQALLLGILQENQMMIDAQIEAAYTYQEWGEEKPGYYRLAIIGSTKYKEIWGWGQLARRVARLVDTRTERGKKFSNIFHEARYNLALCRLRWAQSASGKEKSDLLEQADKDIVVVQRLYPEMGGKEWYEKYDDLLRKIQKLRGQRSTGLEGTAEETKSG